MKVSVWHKRFQKRLNPEVLRFTDSTRDDTLLIPYEIRCALAHIGMLKKQRLISQKDYVKLKEGLNKIHKSYRAGRYRLSPLHEDVHMNLEFSLKKVIGDVADKLHTARSRNDLIATELRLYTRDQIKMMIKALIRLQETILQRAKKNQNRIMPGYTHLQQAQPMPVSYYLSSFFFKFQRDIEQLFVQLEWISVLPLGSCAFAGTGIEIDRRYLADYLGFEYTSLNGLDGVSDRDFVLDLLYSTARIMVHLSSLAEDLCIFSSQEFRIVNLDDSVTTGSSIMPHKKNPDIGEILRAKCAKAIGSLVASLTLLKGLPSSYNRDLQELKPILFNQVKEIHDCLKIARILLSNCEFTTKDTWQNEPNFMGTVDLIDYLVKRGAPFRKVYNIIGECIKETRGDMEGFIKIIAKRTRLKETLIKKILTPAFSIENKRSEGGAGFYAVRKTLRTMEAIIKRNRMKWTRSR